MTITITGRYTQTGKSIILPTSPEFVPGVLGILAVESNFSNILEVITITTASNSVDFGDLLNGGRSSAATSNGPGDRGLWAGGHKTGEVISDIVEYITISSSSNSQDFGDLTAARYGLGAASNGTNDRGVFWNGWESPEDGFNNPIDFVTISSTGNAINFGDAHKGALGSATSNGSNERGVYGGGHIAGALNVITYITISSAADSVDFGDLLAAKRDNTATSNGPNERGIFAGGWTGNNPVDVIQFITISSLGDAIDFGNLTVAGRAELESTSNGTDERGIFAGGSGFIDVIDFITISSASNAVDFGDMSDHATQKRATSDGLT